MWGARVPPESLPMKKREEGPKTQNAPSPVGGPKHETRKPSPTPPFLT